MEMKEQSRKDGSKGTDEESEEHTSELQKLMSEPQTPGLSEHSKNRRLGQVRGRLIHALQTPDGNLCWLPPATSSPRTNCYEERDQLLIEENARLMGRHSMSNSEDLDAEVSSHFEDLMAEPCSAETSLGNPCSAQGDDSACPQILHIMQQMDLTDTHSLPQQVSSLKGKFGHNLQHDRTQEDAAYSSEKSYTSEHSKDSSQKQRSSKSRSTPSPKKYLRAETSLSPYLISKLKPGKHILGEKHQRIYIRPGQLRDWAAAAPSLNGSSAKKVSKISKCDAKSCRSLF